jgi:xanthine/uracil permease
MYIGIFIFLAGLVLVLYLLNVHFQKRVLKNIGVIIGVLMAVYGLILMLQPPDDEYVKFTKTTISKEKVQDMQKVDKTNK